MNYKLQCMNEGVARSAYDRWPACTIQAGSALLCFDITPDELAMIQQYTGSYTVELSDEDIRLIERYGTVPGTE